MAGSVLQRSAVFVLAAAADVPLVRARRRPLVDFARTQPLVKVPLHMLAREATVWVEAAVQEDVARGATQEGLISMALSNVSHQGGSSAQSH